jgi:hypothetical protein
MRVDRLRACRLRICIKIVHSTLWNYLNNIRLATLGTRAFAPTFACLSGQAEKQDRVCARCPGRSSAASPKCKACAQKARLPLVPGLKIVRLILDMEACKVLATICLRSEVALARGDPTRTLSVFSYTTASCNQPSTEPYQYLGTRLFSDPQPPLVVKSKLVDVLVW